MRILADINIPALPSLLANAGSLSFYTERQPPQELLAEADVLLVRSITRVDHALLAQAPQLKFVATATIGTEHLDLKALAERGIEYASAPGANADSVGEFVLVAVLRHIAKYQCLAQVADLDIAIVGAGNTGRATGKRLAALGANVHYYDPPLLAQQVTAEQGDDRNEDIHDHWQRVLTADVISCHVPMVTSGEHPTHHLFDIEALQSLHSRQLLINCSRGAVIDNDALLRRCQQDDQPQLILDVWEGEPQINTQLLEYVALATPHIAGHSAEGKVGGAVAIARALHEFINKPFTHSLQSVLPPCQWPAIDANQLVDLDALLRLMLERFAIANDDDDMRRLGVSAAGFDQLRKHYRQDNPRRQLNNQIIACHNSEQVAYFSALGFNAQMQQS